MSNSTGVLIVEDELIVAKDLQQTLNRMGYDAFAIATSAEEALDICSERPPDVVLMDIRIKGELDGIHTAGVLHDRFHVPVIYLTAHVDDATLERAKATIPYGYLSKPIRSAELHSAIEIAVYRRELEKAQEKTRDLEAEKDALLRAQALKNAFLVTMSHELRTPLNGVIGFAQLLRDGMAGPVTEEQRDFLEQVFLSGQRFVRLAETVLDLANLESGGITLQPETIDLRIMVEELIATLQPPRATDQIRIELLIAPSCARIVSDRHCLRQIIYGYLSNAVKFAPKGDAIRFRAAQELSQWLRIEVQDAGTEISPEDVQRLFVAFEQLDYGLRRKFEGAGIGLAVAKLMAEYLGGRVGYEGSGEGNKFFAVLPLRLTLRPDARQPR